METITLNPTRTKSSYTTETTESWELALRPVSGVDDDSWGNTRKAKCIGYNFTPTFSTYTNHQTFIEFDTSLYSGATTDLVLSALSMEIQPGYVNNGFDCFVAGVSNLYPETPQIYWPEEITDDFDYYQQVNIPESSRMVHAVPGQIVLGNTTCFCIGSWNVITEIAPTGPDEFIYYEIGTRFVADDFEYSLVFDYTAPVKKGNVLFNAFSL